MLFVVVQKKEMKIIASNQLQAVKYLRPVAFSIKIYLG